MVTLGLATNMAWQLAIVVLVPVVGGALLDSHFDTEPVLTIIGLVIALVGMILVVRNTVKQLNGYMAVTNKETSDDN
jgi:F0F1-type ATP synthase assembly protein I